MKKLWSKSASTLAICGMGFLVCCATSCNEDDEPVPYVLQQEDISVKEPEGGFIAQVDQLFRIEVESVSDEGVVYSWTLDGESIPGGKTLEYMFPVGGEYELVLTARQEKKKIQLYFLCKSGFWRCAFFA